jgi:hypothetical protein
MPFAPEKGEVQFVLDPCKQLQTETEDEMKNEMKSEMENAIAERNSRLEMKRIPERKQTKRSPRGMAGLVALWL